mgnify:CR=1 FL=1
MRQPKRFVALFAVLWLLLGSYIDNVEADSTDLPVLADAPVPNNLKPTLSLIKSDRPTPYKDRCQDRKSTRLNSSHT